MKGYVQPQKAWQFDVVEVRYPFFSEIEEDGRDGGGKE